MADNQREPRKVDLRELLNGMTIQLMRLERLEEESTGGRVESERAMLMMWNLRLRLLDVAKVLNGEVEV